MFIRNLAIKTLPVLLAIATLQPAVAASPDRTAGRSLTAAFNQSNVSFRIRNERHTSLELRMGEEVRTIPALTTVKLKLRKGTRITFNQTAGSDVAGALVFVADGGDSNVNTVVIH